MVDECGFAAGVWLHFAEFDFTLHTVEGVINRNVDGRVLVLAACAKCMALGVALPDTAEDRREEIAELGFIARPMAGAATVEFEAIIQTGWWLEVTVSGLAIMPASRRTVGQSAYAARLFLSRKTSLMSRILV